MLGAILWVQAIIIANLPSHSVSECLIDCRATLTDIPTSSSDLRKLITASIGAFSLDFPETCSLITSGFSVKDSDPEESGFYEFWVPRPGSTPTSIKQYIGKCTDLQNGDYFNYLNTIDTGLFVEGEYVSTCNTTDFTPDDSYVPLPESRDQTCIYGARLVQPVPGKFGAIFPETKKPVAYGFDTTFRFKVINKSKYCQVLQQQTSLVTQTTQKCIQKGGRGFAFVIQNAASPGDDLGNDDLISYQINVATGANFGYNFPQNLAIEFDYFFDPTTDDPNWNHIAVMVPTSLNAADAQSSSNSASHTLNMLAIADSKSLPPLDEGSHKVRVTYDVSSNINIWQEMLSNEWLMRPLTQRQQDMLTWWSFGRLGTLAVYLDDILIIKAFLDLASVIQADPISAPLPGGSWVGFVASTGPTSDTVATPVILSWSWSSPASPCPTSTSTATCQFGHKVSDIDSSNPRTGGESDIQFYVRNIARTKLKIFATLKNDDPSQLTPRQCSGLDSFAWDQIHPYYGGCSYPVAVGPNLDSIIITDEIGSRSVSISDPQLINRDFQSQLFLRRAIPEYCVIEHQSDYYKLFFGQCNCAYCVRVFNNQRLYSVFYNQICSERYTFSCNCFEVSQMTTNAFTTDYQHPSNPWKVLIQPNFPSISAQLMQYQEHTVCRGCSFDYHCNFMLPIANCDTPSTIYRVGNPLEPSPNGSFEDWDRGDGAEDGIIKGNACNCQDRIYEPEYLNTRNQQVHVSAYLSAYLPASIEACLTQLKIGGNADVSSYCGYPVSVNLLHYPNGQACSTCTLAALALMNIPTLRYKSLKDCVYAAIQDGKSPWSQCEETVAEWTDVTGAQSDPNGTLYSLLNGVATHFLTECPGADFNVRGAVCAPNLHAVGILPMQMITSEAANSQLPDDSYPIWWDGVGCMNAMCQLTSRSACYRKLVKILFRTDNVTQFTTCYDLLGSNVECTFVNNPTIDTVSNSLVLNRDDEQYGYTDSLPLNSWSLGGSSGSGLKAKTLEVWTQVASTDVITDMVEPNVDGLSASNSWGDDYVPSKSLSLSDVSTFWHSQTSDAQNFTAIWAINFGPVAVKTVQSFTLSFHELPPAAFTVEASVDGGATWKVVSNFTNNNLLSITSSTFFKFNAIRLVMTSAANRRTYGIDTNKYAYAMSGFGAFSDLEVSRLKPTEAAMIISYQPSYAFDGSLATWWSTTREPETASQGWISVSLPNVDSVVLVRLVARRGYVPSTVAMSIALGGNPLASVSCNAANPACLTGTISPTSPEINYSLSPLNQLSELRFDFVGSTYRDDSIIQISEIEIFQNAVATSYSPTVCGGGACSFPITVTGPATYSFTTWQLPSAPTEFGTFVINLASYSGTGSPATLTVRSPSSYTGGLPTMTLSPIGSLAFIFSTFVHSNSDLIMTFTVPTGTSLTIQSIEVNEILRVDIPGMIAATTASVSASDFWAINYPPVSSVAPITSTQGDPNNIYDLDRWTEFRTKLGAPSLVGTVSSDPDFILTTSINRVINIDAIFLSYSYRSRWFRFRTKSLVSPAVPDAVCEWTPGQTFSTGAGCSNSATSLAPSISKSGSVYKAMNPYDFVFSQSPIGNNLPSNSFDLTLMQSSAVDTLGDNQPILGIREMAIYSAYETIAPYTCAVSTSFDTGTGLFSPSNCPSTLFDKLFSTVLTATPVAINTGNYYLDFDLAGPTQVKDFTVYWGASNGVPVQLRVYSSNTPNASPCDFTGADPTSSEFSFLITDPSAPVVYVAPSGYIEQPVRCFRLSFDSIPQSGFISIAEVVIRLTEPSFGAAVASSTLSNPSNTLDAVSVSAAIASSVNAVNTNTHYIMIDLNSPKTYPPGHTPSTISPDIWGLYMVFTSTVDLDKSSIRLYACDPAVGSGSFSDCVGDSNTLSVSVPYASVTTSGGFVFGPLNCPGCTRVCLTFNSIAGVSGVGVFGIGTINIFASFNQAMFGGITAALAPGDSRAWDYGTDKAVDGDSTTAWVAEPDVNSAEFIVSLIPEGPTYDPLSSAYIPAQSSQVSPTHVATITVNFLYPMIEFAIDTSTDGQTWSEQLLIADAAGMMTGVVNDLLYANYVRVRLIEPFPLQTPLTLTSSGQSSWYSPLMGITSITATTLTNLATGSVTTATGTVNSANFFAITTSRWLTLPPGPTIGVYNFPPTGTDISGIELIWYFAPSNFTVFVTDVASTDTMLTLQQITATSPATSAYSYTTFMSQITSIRIEIISFAAYNGISMALLKSLNVYKPNMSSKLAIQSVSATSSVNTGFLIDGDLSTYWSKTGVPSVINIVLAGGNNLISTIVINWGTTICSDFTVSGTVVGSSTSTLIATVTGNDQAAVTIHLFKSFQTLTIDMTAVYNDNSAYPQFSVAEVSVYGSVATLPSSATQTTGSTIDFDSPEYVIDVPASPTSTMWMVSPVHNYMASSATLTVTLGTVYKASGITVTWGWTPWDPTTLNIANQLRQYVVFTDSACSYSDPLNYQHIELDFTIVDKIDTYSNSVFLKCFSVILLAGAPDFGGQILGPSISDIAITLDQNLLQGQTQYVDESDTTSWWNFPASRMADNSMTTAWLSRKQSTTAEIRLELGQVYNLAGVDINFSYAARVITYYYSAQSCATTTTFSLAYGPVANNAGNLLVTLSGLAVQFVARCVRIVLQDPLTTIQNPDSLSGSPVSVFGINQFYVYHMVGGGGVFGIEAQNPNTGVWGTIFDSIAFGPYQPNQWHMLSESQSRSKNVDGPYIPDDTTSMVQIVATFSSSNVVTIYRNGVQYGSAYTSTNPLVDWSTITNVRLVFGLASSQFASATSTDVNTILGSPPNKKFNLNQYYSGSIQSMTLLSEALNAEEVMGLYLAQSDYTKERACHCYDACPTGFNKFYPTIPVPCSGQGVCLRQYDPVTGLPATVAGICRCSPGFSGSNCEEHCSDTAGGCCTVDDDCPLGTTCNTSTNYCQ